MSTDREKLTEKMDRIRLATALGWTPAEAHSDNPEWRSMAFSPKGSGPMPWPDPFTDANDDYAVLEWFRSVTSKAMANREKDGEPYSDFIWSLSSAFTNLRACEYQIGDYARAALQVLHD